MIHVVHVVTRTNIGGPSVILDGLLEDTSGEVRYTVVRGEVDPTEGDYFADRDSDPRFITVQGLGRSVSPLSDIKAFLKMLSILRTLDPDIVHTHMAKAGVVGRLAAWVARVPVRVHTYHGHLLYGYFTPLKTRFLILVERLLNLITTHCVVVGSAVQKDLIDARIVSLQRSSMISPGIPEVPLDGVLDRCGVPSDKWLIGFVGRLTTIKRPDRFLETALELRKVRDDVEFLILGDGPLGESIRRTASSINGVHCLGWRRDIYPILRALDLLVVCSDNEGIPLVLIESSMCGVPSVASRIGSISDVVKDESSGVLIDELNSVAFAQAINNLLNDPARLSSLGKNARLFAQSKFSLTVQQDEHRRLYRRLIDGKRLR